MTEKSNEAAHYAECDYCPAEYPAKWSVIIDQDGEVVQIECKHCGGTGWERGQEAGHV